MKQSITLHIFQHAHIKANAKLDEYDFYAYGFVPRDRETLKIGEITVEVETPSAKDINSAQLAALREQLGTAVAGVTAIERQIQNLLAIENVVPA